jgi:hypothetical protein
MSSDSSALAPASTATVVAPDSRIWLQIALMAVAGFESLLGLSEFAGAFDLHDAPLSFGQFFINARLAIHPFFAITAVVLAACRHFRAAIIVLAAYIFAAWLSELPTMSRFGIEGDWSPVGLSLLADELIFPPLAVAAIVLARLDRYLWLGAIFVALPSANLLLGITMFTIGVMIYGF